MGEEAGWRDGKVVEGLLAEVLQGGGGRSRVWWGEGGEGGEGGGPWREAQQGGEEEGHLRCPLSSSPDIGGWRDVTSSAIIRDYFQPTKDPP